MLPLVIAFQILTISPPAITDCTNGLGHATLSWNVPQNFRVQVRVGGTDGIPMTGLENHAGSADTGDWVSNGMTFSLVNDAGLLMDRVTAAVNCGGTPDTTAAAFTASNSYLPLQVGNRWVYRTNSRTGTSDYTIWTLTRTIQINGKTWFLLETRGGSSNLALPMPCRTDADGRLYRLPRYPSDVTEELWLDPSGATQLQAVLQVQQTGIPVATPFGTLPGLRYMSYGSLAIEHGTLIRGLGLLESSTNMISGSSGGFLSSLSLVEARIGQAVWYATPATSVSIAAESARLQLTDRKVTNCAVPCYFVACYFAPGTDPPNTWKPCFQARVRAGVAGCDQPVRPQADVQLSDASGNTLTQRTIGLTASAVRCEATAYTQLPLYTIADAPFPTGAYRLSVVVRDGQGEIGTASVPLKIE